MAKKPVPRIEIKFTNGSKEKRVCDSVYAARIFARDHISYSGGRVKQVWLVDEYGTRSKLWDDTWGAASQYAGLWRF